MNTFNIPLIDLLAAIGATLAGVSSVALYFKQLSFQEYQTKRFSLQDFKSSDVEDSKVQLQQFLLGGYFLSENGQRYSLKQLLSEYNIFNQANEHHVHSIVNNRRLFKRNISTIKIEESIHHLVERILRQLESLANSKVDEYEYLDTAHFLLDALKALEHCGFGAYDSHRKDQLFRIRTLLKVDKR